MRFASHARRAVWYSLPILALYFWAGPAGAQVTDVVVGVTPICPYGGFGTCWGGAYEALGRLDGVKSVVEHPDSYNCTAHVERSSSALPDVARWADQFKSFVGQVYRFRGVEVTAEGTVEADGAGLALRIPGLDRPVPLAPLEHKLQWNYTKASARGPEPDEKIAYDQLSSARKAAKAGDFKTRVTGPLWKSGQGVSLEIREYVQLGRPAADVYGRP